AKMRRSVPPASKRRVSWRRSDFMARRAHSPTRAGFESVQGRSFGASYRRRYQPHYSSGLPAHHRYVLRFLRVEPPGLGEEPDILPDATRAESDPARRRYVAADGMRVPVRADRCATGSTFYRTRGGRAL